MSARSRVISALGLVFILVALGQAMLEVGRGNAYLATDIDFVLISLPGVLFLSVGRWLSTVEIDRALYPRIAGWCLGGVGVMLVFLALRAVHPGVEISFPFGERHGVRASDASSSTAGSRSGSAGGEIWVDSEPGEGSTFTFTLPKTRP